MIYKCLIIDDEPPAIEVLKMYISTIDQIEVAGVCNNALEALRMLGENQVDLLFLDIEMPKLLGTEFIKTLSHPPKVIFTTAHKDFAIQAFELDAIDYLLKPISYERFLKAVNKIIADQNNVNYDLINLNKGFLYFRSQRKMVKVFINDILYIESLKDYVVIYRDGLPALKSKLTIGAMQAMLPKHLFIRTHRSFIIATNKVSAYTNYDIEIGQTQIPIGRNYNKVIEQLPKGEV